MRHICPIIGQTKVTKVDMSKFDSKISGRNEAKLHNILGKLSGWQVYVTGIFIHGVKLNKYYYIFAA